MSSVKALTVSGYKSIRELRNFPLTNLNVLIGANGAGKSNFVSLFRLLNEMYEQRLQVYVQTQGGPDALLHFGRNTSNKLHAEFYFADDRYKFELIPTNDNRLIFQTEEVAKYLPNSRSPMESTGKGGQEESWMKNGFPISHVAESALNPLQELNENFNFEIARVRDTVSNWRVYRFQDTGDKAKIKQIHPANDNLRLKPDAANLAVYLRMLHDKHPPYYQRIVDTIRLVAPFFGDFVHRPNAEHVELEWTQKGKPDTPFKALHLSDGTLRFICLATLLLQPSELLPDTILIDEPELGLHPYAISVLADIFKQVAEGKQLIVSTQSVELVNELSPEDIIVVDQENDASIFKRFTQEELKGWLEEYSLGEMWKCNILGGRP